LTYISKYTPSHETGEKLERLFVIREPILADGVERISDAVATGRLAHVLYSGPRGAGKTHLVSLIHHRAKALPGFGEAFTLSWLPEDPLEIYDFDSLMSSIEQHRTPGNAPLTVVIAENFDEILQVLGTDGQRRLRARIERDADLLLVVTTTRLSSNLISQARPFYGFFDTIELRPFDVDEARVMLRRVAEISGETALMDRLGDPDVSARLAVVSQLTGGQPRSWALLSAGLTIDNVTDMLELLLAVFDNLTPYYQEQLKGLSGNETKIVLTLIKADHPMTVQELAKETGITPATVSSTVRRLQPAWLEPRTGWLQKFVDKRRTYYQLVEPLARLAIQVKITRGEPMSLVIDFLTAWYSRNDLDTALRQSILDASAGDYESGYENAYGDDIQRSVARQVIGAATLDGISLDYVKAAVDAMSDPTQELREQLITACDLRAERLTWQTANLPALQQAAQIDDALRMLQERRDASGILGLPSALSATIEAQLEGTAVGLVRLEIALFAVRSGGGPEWADRAVEAMVDAPADQLRLAQISLGCLRLILGESKAGLALLRDAISLDSSVFSSDEWQVIATLLQYRSRGLSESAFPDLLDIVAPLIPSDDLPRFANLALLVVSEVVEDDKISQAIEPVGRRIVGTTWSAENPVSQLAAAIRSLVNPEDVSWMMALERVNWLRFQLDEAGDLLNEAEERVLIAAEDPLFDPADMLEMRADVQQMRAEIGMLDEADHELRIIISQARETLGVHHPHVGMFIHNLGYAHKVAGDMDGAIAVLREQLAEQIAVAGPRDGSTLYIRRQLGSYLIQASRPVEAVGVIGDGLVDQFASYTAAHPNSHRMHHIFIDAIRLSQPPEQAANSLMQAFAEYLELSNPGDPHLQCISGAVLQCVRNLDSNESAIAILTSLYEKDQAILRPCGELELSMMLAAREESEGNIEPQFAALTRAVELAPASLCETHRSDWAAVVGTIIRLSDRSRQPLDEKSINALRETRAGVDFEGWKRTLQQTLLQRPSHQAKDDSPNHVDRPPRRDVSIPRKVLIALQARINWSGEGNFSLNNKFIEEVGLNGIPPDWRRGFLDAVYVMLEERVGTALVLGLPNHVLDEFGYFVDRDTEKMRSWLDANEPGWADGESYRGMAKANPDDDEADLLGELGSMLWLVRNRPQYPSVVQEEMAQLKYELGQWHDFIMTTIEKADSSRQVRAFFE